MNFHQGDPNAGDTRTQKNVNTDLLRVLVHVPQRSVLSTKKVLCLLARKNAFIMMYNKGACQGEPSRLNPME